MQKVDVIAHIHASAGNEAAVREVLEGFVAPTRAEEGCLRYDLFQDIQDPLKFTFIEEWTTEAGLDTHGQSAHILAGRQKLEGKLSGPSWVQRARRIL